ncbi:MAG: hypothetical protein K8I29_17050 [Alphaproteobacteria bacterium]|uniref:Uncharacterized protein n=1 Tax=Candidatus Nitrobium versatile TaxID=2884831 RepID=A0A953M2T6_9BACT|nr:hypothetical protein [Candidatus Nitrobium versatile]
MKTGTGEKELHFEESDSMLSLWTTSFRAEKGSVLHSGIYNREMASSLAAGACIIAAAFLFAAVSPVIPLYSIVALVSFVPLFLLFRRYVFREELLCVEFDRRRGTVSFSLNRPFGRREVSYPLTEIDTVRQDCRVVPPENPDGIRVVEKIALQHGTVIPGFGETAEFYTVEIEFKGGERIMVFSSREPSRADEIAQKIINFIER